MPLLAMVPNINIEWEKVLYHLSSAVAILFDSIQLSYMLPWIKVVCYLLVLN